jgi:hypothetical protein
MIMKQTAKISILAAPFLLLTVTLLAMFWPVRVSLVLSGHPLARVVSKRQLDVFQYVPIDSMRATAIVFNDERAIGWIYQPMMGYARFVPFIGKPGFDANTSSSANVFVLLPICFWLAVLWCIAQSVVLGCCGLIRAWRSRHS